jgi:hypothetical protein
MYTDNMPRVNIYIRKEDVDKWDAIENRPEWIHEKLNEDTEDEDS